METGLKISFTISLNSVADADLLRSLEGIAPRRRSAAVRDFWRAGLGNSRPVLQAVEALHVEVRAGFGRLEHLLVQLPTGQVVVAQVREVLEKDDPRAAEIRTRLGKLGT